MGEMRPQPRVWRLVLGFVAAPWPLAALYAWWAQAVAVKGSTTSVLTYFAATSLVAYVPVLLFGLPLHFGLRHHLRPRLAWMALFGAGIALVGGLLFILLILLGGHAGGITVRLDLPPGSGAPTRAAQPFPFLAALVAVGFFGALGALSGFVFWLVVVCGDRRLASLA